jgi:chromate transporter
MERSETDTGLMKIFLSFFRLGLTAFGGPAMIAYIKDLAIKNSWLTPESFRDGIVLCQSIPGATAMQMAGYVGLKVKGFKGALASFVGFGLPAFFLMLLFSILYDHFYALHWVNSIFSGLQVVVVAIIAQSTYSFGRTLVVKNKDFFKNIIVGGLAASFLGIGINPFLVILGAGLISLVLFKEQEPVKFSLEEGGEEKRGIWIALILIVILCCMAILFLLDRENFNLSVIMMKIDLFAFGGGFTSLPLMLHEIVEQRKWLDEKTFMAGIALGQVTPGPIIITSTFVGYLLGGFNSALIATISIFTPSFLLLVGIAPYFDRLKRSPYFLKATKGILATFVGLLFYAMIQFALAVPWDILRILIGVIALTALLKKTDLLYVVGITAGVSIWLFH